MRFAGRGNYRQLRPFPRLLVLFVRRRLNLFSAFVIQL